MERRVDLHTRHEPLQQRDGTDWKPFIHSVALYFFLRVWLGEHRRPPSCRFSSAPLHIPSPPLPPPARALYAYRYTQLLFLSLSFHFSPALSALNHVFGFPYRWSSCQVLLNNRTGHRRLWRLKSQRVEEEFKTARFDILSMQTEGSSIHEAWSRMRRENGWNFWTDRARSNLRGVKFSDESQWGGWERGSGWMDLCYVEEDGTRFKKIAGTRLIHSSVYIFVEEKLEFRWRESLCMKYTVWRNDFSKNRMPQFRIVIPTSHRFALYLTRRTCENTPDTGLSFSK